MKSVVYNSKICKQAAPWMYNHVSAVIYVLKQ